MGWVGGEDQGGRKLRLAVALVLDEAEAEPVLDARLQPPRNAAAIVAWLYVVVDNLVSCAAFVEELGRCAGNRV